ncbi:MAG: uracil-DNA glycosylase [Phycisphaerales bacterium]
MISRTEAVTALRAHAETLSLLGVDHLPLPLRARTPPVAPAPAPTDKSNETAHQPRNNTTSAKSQDSARDTNQCRLDELRARHDRECPHCTSVKHHNNTVFGEGDPAARLMFVGEAPGAEEDKTGRPFVGRAGQLLDKMISAMGLRREDVYIANVLKARPPNNATPTPDEAAKCGAYLREQIAIINPQAIVCLGLPATHYLLDTKASLSSMRGRWHEFQPLPDSSPIPVMPTFHPAFLLRQYTDENRRKVWSDLQKAMERISPEAR